MSSARFGDSHDTEALKQKAGVAKDAVVDLAGEAAQYASIRARDVKDSAVLWAQVAKEKAVNLGEEAVECIQRNPYQAIAVAAGIGFVAGLLLKRR